MVSYVSPVPDNNKSEKQFVTKIEPTVIVTPTETVQWKTYHMVITLKISDKGKLWMPVPEEWDGAGMKNVVINSITPTPDDLYQEPQGNLIAYWDMYLHDTDTYSIDFQSDLAPIIYFIDLEKIGEYDQESELYQRYTAPSNEIKSNNQEIINLAKQIVGEESNPYFQAKLIHKWVSENISSGNYADSLETIKNKSGDYGGHSNPAVAFLRSLKIPARSVGGLWTDYKTGRMINVDTKNGYGWGHIWSEFYLPNYGWIQFDTSAGLQNFAEIDQSRLILYHGEDIELGNGYPYIRVPFFHTPQVDWPANSGFPVTNIWGDSLSLKIELVDQQ